MRAKRTRIQKKEKIMERIDKLDPNNNKNPDQKPLIKRRGKKVHDDSFEHRTSGEIVSK